MIKKTTYHKITASFLVIIMLLLTANPFSVQAGGGASSDIGFSVRAILPENQQSSSTSYFDLRMTPGQTQELTIEIENETDTEITVELGSISASTNQNGVIDYKTPNIKDTSLKIPFSSIATVNQSKLTVPPRGTVPVTFTVSMPEQLYDGAILGGIIITKSNLPTSGTSTGGAEIQNIYSYVIGVKLTETDTPIKPDFELFSVKPDAINYSPAVVHFIRNKAPLVIKNMSVDVTIIRNDTGEVVAQVKRSGIDMAPNSVMELAATLLKNEAGTPITLQPGEYTSSVKLTHEGKNWDYEESFKIGEKESTIISEQTNPGAKPQGLFCEMPLWLIILIIFFGILLVFIFIFLLLLLLKRRKKDDEERQKRSQARKQFFYKNQHK